jgi:monoamine oxidase
MELSFCFSGRKMGAGGGKEKTLRTLRWESGLAGLSRSGHDQAVMNFNRRKFLGAACAFSLLPVTTRSAQSAELDVAIIGGGAAGTYTAWRLAKERPDLRVRLFEASARIGGRLHSVAFPQAPHLVTELGGMRFLDAHRHVSGLVAHLGLPLRNFPIDRDANRVLLRGRNFAQRDIRAGGARFPYRIPDVDQKPGADYFDRAVARVLPNAAHMTAADWRKIRAGFRVKNKLLRDWTNRDLLLQGMSAEELKFSEDISGYDDWIEGETGLDELDYYFVHDDESKPFNTISGGYQRLPLMLAAQAQRSGVLTASEARLVSLRVAGNGFRLTLRDGHGQQTALTAQSVVLALPRRALELIENFPARREPRFARLIRSVTPIPASKSLLLYERPWWRDHGVVEGRSITDLPARQFYCFGTEVGRPSLETESGHGVLMAYCDEASVQTWTKLAAPSDPSGHLALSGDSALAREVHREAELVIGQTKSKPLAARFQDWSADPYGGGWHYYARGHDGTLDGEAMIAPLPGRKLYVCGEAYSFAQGWVEGALERAETVLQRHFALKKPAWLKS